MQIAAMLERTRQRTLELTGALSEQALNAVHDPLLSPIVWDLGHIATFEDLWLVQQAAGRNPLRAELAGVYDPDNTPRRERGKLPYLRSEECLAYMRTVRERTLDCLAEVDLSESASPLLAGGFVYELVARHEQQHSETILQTLQAMTAETYAPARAIELPRALADRSTFESGNSPARGADAMVLVEGSPFEMGASGGWFSYDNERPAHERAIEPFWIDAEPVSNAAMLEFIHDGGYERAELWSSEGWEWRRRERVTLPRYWQRDGKAGDAGLLVRSFEELRPVEPTKPLCHVSWYEADAYARWAGKRLPTESEWEKAASWDGTGVKRAYPWGDERPDSERANLDQLRFGTAEVGAFPGGESACGAQQMLGDVWEWTASTFDRYEGFEPFPYPEYSEPFFGERFKVLRGGAWATQPDAVSTTFRNWDFPERRQIFAGFRCARDAAPDGTPD